MAPTQQEDMTGFLFRILSGLLSLKPLSKALRLMWADLPLGGIRLSRHDSLCARRPIANEPKKKLKEERMPTVEREREEFHLTWPLGRKRSLKKTKHTHTREREREREKRVYQWPLHIPPHPPAGPARPPARPPPLRILQREERDKKEKKSHAHTLTRTGWCTHTMDSHRVIFFRALATFSKGLLGRIPPYIPVWSPSASSFSLPFLLFWTGPTIYLFPVVTRPSLWAAHRSLTS